MHSELSALISASAGARPVMFKKFSIEENVSSTNLLKSSIQRTIKKQIQTSYPNVSEEELEEIMPKKASVYMVKCKDNMNILCIDNQPLFFQSFNDPYIPTLRLVHRYPHFLDTVQVDKGAIKFVLSGADIMCPGLNSCGGRLDAGFLKGKIVAIMAQGQEHAIAIGKLIMSAQEIKSVNRGHGIESLNYLRDGLWLANEISC